MIQLNLLPDVKLEYIRAKRMKRTVLVLSGLVSAAALTLLVFMFTIVGVVQKKHLGNLEKDIKSNTNKLQSIDNLDRILTVQNQLDSLTALHDQKPVVSRLLPFVEQLTPVNATIANLSFNIDDKSITLSGNADSLSTVNKFVDTIKFTALQNKDDPKATKPAFSEVVLNSFSVGKTITYTIGFKFDQDMFDSSKNVALDVPKNKITTRSEVDKPGNNLFKPDPNTSNGQDQ